MVPVILVVVVINMLSLLTQSSDSSTQNTPATLSIGLPGMEALGWDTVVKKAASSQLNFYLWHPNGTKPQTYFDEYLSPKLKDTFGIKLNTLTAVYKDCDKAAMKVVCDVATEVAAGKTTSGGAVDLIWINGENFAAMKKLGLLYGPWATLLPNAANFDFTNDAINSDKNLPIEGLEFPFQIAQAVFIHNKDKVPSPPKTIVDFVTWLEKNPGKFAYADPTKDFTGATFVREFFYEFADDNNDAAEDFSGPFNEKLYQKRSPAVWKALNSIAANLYQKDGKAYYPDDHNKVIRPLVGDETLWMDFSMNVGEATARMANDQVNPWPETMQAYVMTSGSISDTNFLAIPVNAQNKEAALTVVNYIASAGAMFSRTRPAVWGAMQAFDPTASSIKEWDEAFDSVATHYATPTIEELAKHRRGDLSAEYVQRINDDWEKYVKNA